MLVFHQYPFFLLFSRTSKLRLIIWLPSYRPYFPVFLAVSCNSGIKFWPMENEQKWDLPFPCYTPKRKCLTLSSLPFSFPMEGAQSWWQSTLMMVGAETTTLVLEIEIVSEDGRVAKPILVCASWASIAPVTSIWNRNNLQSYLSCCFWSLFVIRA